MTIIIIFEHKVEHKTIFNTGIYIHLRN